MLPHSPVRGSFVLSASADGFDLSALEVCLAVASLSVVFNEGRNKLEQDVIRE